MIKTFSEVVETMDSYCLVKDDVDAIAELAQWPGTKDPYSLIPPTVCHFVFNESK